MLLFDTILRDQLLFVVIFIIRLEDVTHITYLTFVPHRSFSFLLNCIPFHSITPRPYISFSFNNHILRRVAPLCHVVQFLIFHLSSNSYFFSFSLVYKPTRLASSFDPFHYSHYSEGSEQRYASNPIKASIF